MSENNSNQDPQLSKKLTSEKLKIDIKLWNVFEMPDVIA